MNDSLSTSAIIDQIHIIYIYGAQRTYNGQSNNSYSKCNRSFCKKTTDFEQDHNQHSENESPAKSTKSKVEATSSITK